MKTLCIYHGNCADGFAAAWAVRQAYGEENLDFHAGVYQDPPPDVAGRMVLMVDFSYKRPVLLEMSKTAKNIIVLDHHKTAEEDLRNIALETEGCPINVVFDMNRSGAGITWDYFHPGRERPALIDHIEDRDLWRFSLRGTREIQANVFSYPYDFKAWDWLMEQPVEELRKDGEAIERKHFKDIREMLKVVTRDMLVGGFIVPVANLPYTLTSDAGHILAKGEGTDQAPEHPFAACYWDTPKGRVFSLRSAEGGIDVSAIAKQYGGGGHKHASGFRLDWADISKMEMPPINA